MGGILEPDGRHRVHDPTIIKKGNNWYVFSTGRGIQALRSTNGGTQVEIAVSREAGELIVEAPADGLAPPDGRTVVLSHDGSIELLDYLGQWGTIEETASGRRRVTIPGMAPGPYTACLVAASERAAIWLGAAPADRCTSGTLAAGDRLALLVGPISDSQVSR